MVSNPFLMAETTPRTTPEVTLRRTFTSWWPLAASWLLMAMEQPAIGAVLARLPNPEVNLAAYGGIVYALALIIEAPIIMLLAASTALSKDRLSYDLIKRFMMWAGVTLTVIHLLLALTPLYDLLIVGLMQPPPQIIEPGRIGLLLMLPWSWAIAYRRFQQGVLIRFGYSRAVGFGTGLRLIATFSILVLGYHLAPEPGVIAGSLALSFGVLVEAAYAGLRVRSVVRGPLAEAEPVTPVLDLRTFILFYIPLALTSLIQLFFLPVGSAAMSRMPLPLESLAVWPVFAGISFLLRASGVAFNEVAVALLDEEGSLPVLRRFTIILFTVLMALTALIALTPLADLWFQGLSGLTPQLANMAKRALIIAGLVSGLTVLISWYQGALVSQRQTRPISEAVAVWFAVIAVVAAIGVTWGRFPGLYVVAMGFLLGFTAQTVWLWWRSRPVMAALRKRDGVA